jgi:glycosyltransferase involved in cell wall biosynthesis
LCQSTGLTMSNCGSPHFSIVIPTYNRHGKLADLLSSLTRLKYPPTRFETIVVDDGGGIPLDSVISRFSGDLDLTLLKQGNAGPAAARNYGAARAEGQYLAFTDDDCQPEPGWLQALAVGFRESPCCICGGKAVNALRENPYSTASQMLMDYLYERSNPTEKLGAFFPTNNFAVPRAGFLEMGGFDATLRFGEDRDFCYRWASAGYPFVFAPEAMVYHAHELNLFSCLKLHFFYGGGTFQFWRRCAIKGLRPVKVSPPSWYVNLLLSGIRKEKSLAGLLQTLLLTAIQGACTAGFVWEMLKHRGSFRT